MDGKKQKQAHEHTHARNFPLFESYGARHRDMIEILYIAININDQVLTINEVVVRGMGTITLCK